MRALVLSGGAAKGAFQVGALKYLFEQGMTFDLVAGISVGTLNGHMVASHKFPELVHIWENLSSDMIYEGLDPISILKRFTEERRREGFMSNRPAWDLVQRVVHVEDVKIPFIFGVANLVQKDYISYNALDDFDASSPLDYQYAIMASGIQPVLWDTVQSLRTVKYGWRHGCVDGGLENISPLKDVIGYNPDEVVIINCSNSQVQRTPDHSVLANIFTVAMGTLDMLLTNGFRKDVKSFLTINRLVEQAEAWGHEHTKDDGTPYKAFDHLLIEPRIEIQPLDFNWPAVEKSMNHGYEVAQQVYENPRERQG